MSTLLSARQPSRAQLSAVNLSPLGTVHVLDICAALGYQMEATFSK